MESLRERIETEGRNNDYIQRAREDGKFPSEEVAKAIGVEELYRLAPKCVEFRVGVDLKLIQSNSKLVALLEAQKIVEMERGKMPSDFGQEDEMIATYTEQTQQICENITSAIMRGYEAGW